MQAVGKGAYGTVCSARERATGERVAIKKIANCFEHIVDARFTSQIFLELTGSPELCNVVHLLKALELLVWGVLEV